MTRPPSGDRYWLVAAAYVVFRRDRDVLLQRRKDTGWMDGHWAAAAAGHVEYGESAPDAACREAAEELGVTIGPGDLVPLCCMHRSRRTGDPIDERADFFFECRTWAGTPRIMEDAKADGLEWFPLDGLPEPVVPHERFVLERLRDGGLLPVVTYGFAHAAGS